MQTKTDYHIEILENGSSRVVKSVVRWDCDNPHHDRTEVYEDVVQTQIIESVIDPATRAIALSSTPSGSGAAAVLAAADQVWIADCAAISSESIEDHQRGQVNYDAAVRMLLHEVTAWRAARGDQGGTGG